jgi:hypothetical protein
MKKNIQQSLTTSLCLLLFLHINQAQTNFTFLGGYNNHGKPNYLTQPKDDVTNAFVERVRASLPEYYPVTQYNPHYLMYNTHDVTLMDTAQVFVTFVDEGAGYQNTLAYYIFDSNNPPTQAPTNLTVIFPNMTLENNILKKGDKVSLGFIPKGKSIGFALIANGFQNSMVTTGYHILYTNPKFNPETDTSLRRHSVILQDSAQMLLYGFEDLRRDQGADNDFNDAVFYVTAKGKIAGKFPVTVGVTNVGSGNEGGLESDGCLADAIAKRNFHRTKAPSVSYDNPENLSAFKEIKSGSLNTRGDVELEQYIPENPLYEPTRAFLTTPSDLIGITNAKKVLSVDYFDPATDERMAAILTSKTEGSVYNHTKTICDRLMGSRLLNIENITIKGMPFIRTTLEREDGSIEYTISFSVSKDDEKTATFVSRWGVDDYPARSNYWNYQVWAQAPHLSQKIVEEIIAKYKAQFSNIKTETIGKTPTVYVRSGNYDNGFLTLKVFNPIQAKSLTLTGNSTLTETRQRLPMNQKIVLSGNEEETVKVYVGSIFDMGFRLVADKTELSDALYFADGVWGLDYDKNVSKVDKFEVNASTPTNESGLFTLERDPILRGQVKDYVSIFRTLRPASVATDLLGFKNLSFVASGTDIVDVILVKKSIKEWKNQYHSEVRLSTESQQFNLAFSDFSNGTNQPLIADDITTAVFTIKGDGRNVKTIEVNLQNVVFNNYETKKALNTEGVIVSPNPVEDVAEVNFKLEERGSATITLTNTNGQVVMTKNDVFAKGNNRFKVDMSNYPMGMYILNITTAKEILKAKIMFP